MSKRKQDDGHLKAIVDANKQELLKFKSELSAPGLQVFDILRDKIVSCMSEKMRATAEARAEVWNKLGKVIAQIEEVEQLAKHCLPDMLLDLGEQTKAAVNELFPIVALDAELVKRNDLRKKILEPYAESWKLLSAEELQQLAVTAVSDKVQIDAANISVEKRLQFVALLEQSVPEDPAPEQNRIDYHRQLVKFRRVGSHHKSSLDTLCSKYAGISLREKRVLYAHDVCTGMHSSPQDSDEEESDVDDEDDADAEDDDE
jgi:hypothetical protein